MMEALFDLLDVLTEKVLPIVFLVILGISGMILIFGVSSIRRMRGRRITGWLSIGSMVLVISFPYVSESDRAGNVFGFFPEFLSFAIAVLGYLLFFVAPILTLAVTTILLSRAFTYVATTVHPILSRILTFLFSFGSGVFFAILYWFSWRAVTGDGRMMLAFVGMGAGLVVICISLYVNVLEKQIGK
jgi:hypothetical protein